MATATDAPHVEHEHAHPGEGMYLLVALFLAIVTGAEVVLYYVRLDFRLYAPLLGVLAAVKFATVAMFFMHLRFDSRVFRWFFVTGIILAGTVYTIVLLTFHAFNGRA
ncbi:MAG TPA: cytochrome C oxidase subunit IV family protein [Acidimicrobiales bacterium]|jgi:cytochrome c oxidase subunit 4|nr:cytochrome C oxidase subunit IV family protein [Acidimicrobiales bacterium]